MVKCIVKVGTLQFEQKDEKHPDGIYQQFDEFTVSAERAARFDKNDVKIIPDDVATVSVPIEKTVPVETQKIVEATEEKPVTVETPKVSSAWTTKKKTTTA